MLGDLGDIVGRLRAMLPKRWFNDNTPNLDALLGSLATPSAWLYSLVSYARVQARLTTATDMWLDLVALDYFGSGFIRGPSEGDTSFRVRIQQALLKPAGTRSAVVAGLEQLTGARPTIFEPANCADTGAYGSSFAIYGGFAYGQAGGWGNLMMPHQFLITVSRPPSPGIADLAGYSDANGGYGTGCLSYIDIADVPGEISDTQIQQQLCRLLPVNATAWMRIV